MQTEYANFPMTIPAQQVRMGRFPLEQRHTVPWERHDRPSFVPQPIPRSPALYVPDNRMCRYTGPSEASRVPDFIQGQIGESFSEVDMFLVTEETLIPDERKSSDFNKDEFPRSSCAKADFVDTEEKSEIEKRECEELSLKKAATNVEEESEEARALRIKEKNRIAAKICRRRKKEYIRCLEQRVASLEKQNEALLLKLKFFKDIYDREHNFGC